MSVVKHLIRWLVPAGFISLLQNAKKVKGRQHMWFGNYATWAQAFEKSSGYDNPDILNSCKKALLQVKNGTAVYERDSVIFNKKQYSWPLLSALQNIIIETGRLSVLDFGGSLGSSYYQNRDFLTSVQTVEWNIVEQEKFVLCGKEFFEDDVLKFYTSVDECLEKHKPNVLLISSVLQYLEYPADLLQKLTALGIDYIIIDRTSFIDQAPARITLQTVPEEIYRASYPCHFFSEQEFLKNFETSYALIADFESFADPSMYSEDGKPMYWKGFIFKVKN